MADGYIIIGIHGLANKPPEPTLREWWQEALLEGLERNQGRTDRALSFDLSYWADLRYDSPDQTSEPYVRADGAGRLPRYKEDWLDGIVAKIGNLADAPLDWAKRYFGADNLADSVLRQKLPDLATYYDDESLRERIRDRFADKVRAAAATQKRIMVIAHSMGSIVAYDVLRRIGREDMGLRVDHLVTIGSPLGLSQVKHRIRQENDLVRTPSVVRKWTNFADRRDLVAADSHLADDYAVNDREVKVRDDMVINTYTNETGDANYHKSYGYLRAPELSEILRGFI